jgi:hypothetical protein
LISLIIVILTCVHSIARFGITLPDGWELPA